MSNKDKIITQIPNELVFYDENGVPVIDIGKREKLIEELRNIPDLLKASNWSDFRRLIRDGWSFSSAYLIDLLGEDTLYEYFINYSDIIMNGNEVRYYNSLPDEIMLYRGSNGIIVNKFTGMSWTYDFSLASVYAINRMGKVYVGNVNKKDVICTFYDEDEFIVKPGSVDIIKELTWKEAAKVANLPVYFRNVKLELSEIEAFTDCQQTQ